jgi:acetyl-CoA carboxylase biotin carboxyl carrier protein
MDIKDIRKIIEMMKQNELSEFELQDEGFRIAIRRRNGGDSQVVVTPQAAQPVLVSPAPNYAANPAPVTVDDPNGEPAAAPAAAEENGHPITSPMVGTFYRASAPDADAFVSVGSEVDEDTVVCIIEAMKVMNEIKAEVRGVVRKILVDNASAVQFGQPLMVVEPA